MTRTIGYGLCLSVSLTVIAYTSVSAFHCLNESGAAVDWFIVYKFPTRIVMPRAPGGPKRKSTGEETLYMDPSTPKMTVSQYKINDNLHPLSRTITQLFSTQLQATDYLYMMYSTLHPGRIVKILGRIKEIGVHVPQSFGHANGVVGFEISDGFWLSHSLPRYPDVRNLNNLLPSNGKRNAQTFICVSLHARHLPDITRQLELIWPKPFKWQIDQYCKVTGSKGLLSLNLQSIAKRYKQHTNVLPFLFKSTGNTRFYSYSKSTEFAQDIYIDFLLDKLKEDIYVQTWPTARSPRLPSNCTGPNMLYNTKAVDFDVGGNHYFIKSTKDHSKWAVTSGQKWICIGNLNRHLSQQTRGGGVICMQNKNVADAFRNAIGNKYHPCPGTKRGPGFQPAIQAGPGKRRNIG